MPEHRVLTDFNLMFAPERWAAIAMFQQMMGPPFEVTPELQKGVSSAANHLSKFVILASLANRLKGRLTEDLAELAEKGYTPAIRSREFAALIEALFCELYAALDGVRRTLYAVYRNTEGVQNSSTEKLFKRAAMNQYGAEFPEVVRAALTSAFTTWFSRLSLIRREVTHGDIGSCHLNEQTQVVSYMHSGLGSATRAFVIDDILKELNQILLGVSQLIDLIFRYLYSKLQPVEQTVFCGIYKGRMYQRDVAPSSDLSFNSGRCKSRVWFEKEIEYACPLRQNCGAYRRAVAEGAAPVDSGTSGDISST